MKQRLIKWRDADGETFSTAIAGDFCPREENSDAVHLWQNSEELRAGSLMKVWRIQPKNWKKP